MYRFITLTVLAFGAAAAQLPAQPSPPIALVGVHVISMADEEVANNQTILVRDGRIAEIGPDATVKIPEGATRVDAEGKYALPGLAEMHGHLAGDDSAMNERILLLNVAYGITTLRNMQGHPAHLALRDRVGRGEILGPRIYTSGPPLSGKRIPTPDEAVKLLDDINNTTKRFGVMVNGTWLSRAEIDEKLAALTGVRP